MDDVIAVLRMVKEKRLHPQSNKNYYSPYLNMLIWKRGKLERAILEKCGYLLAGARVNSSLSIKKAA